MKTAIRKLQGGVPTGGNTDDVLTKNSNTDYDEDFLPPTGGGTGTYSVQADETIFKWTTQQLSKMNLTVSAGSGWSVGGFANCAILIDSSILGCVNHGGTTDFTVQSTAFQYTHGKQLRLKFNAKMGDVGTAGNTYQLDFGNAQIVWDNGALKWFFKQTGAGPSSVDITASFGAVANSDNLIEIVWDSTNLLLYLNGSVIATIAVVYPATSFTILFHGQYIFGINSPTVQMGPITISREM